MIMLGWHILNSGYKSCIVVDSRLDKLKEAEDSGYSTLNIDPRAPSEVFFELLEDPNCLPLYTSNDQCVKNLNFMLEKAGYSSCSQESIEIISDKFAVLSELKKEGLVKREFDLKPLKGLHFSKPRNGASSVGVEFVRQSRSKDENSLYEAPLVGSEYSMDGLVDSKGNVQIAVGKKFKYRGDYYSSVSTTVVYGKEFSENLPEYFLKVIGVLKLTNTAVHGEVILTPSGPELIEISARQTGMTGSIILPRCGLDFILNLRKIQMGELIYKMSNVFVPQKPVIYFFYERVGFLFNNQILKAHGFLRLIDGKPLNKALQTDDLRKTGFEVLEYIGNQNLHSDEINIILRWLENA